MAACMTVLCLITIYLFKPLVPVLSQLPNLAWDGQQKRKVGMKACEARTCEEKRKAAEHIHSFVRL